jgi:hypothetical protein
VCDRNVYVEVKSDQHACRGKDTGNVFVEFEQDTKGVGIWKPSGVSVTQADYWAEEFDYDCWLVTPTARIRWLVEYWRQKEPRRVRLGGDFNHHRGALVPVSSIVRPSVRGIVIPSEATA